MSNTAPTPWGMTWMRRGSRSRIAHASSAVAREMAITAAQRRSRAATAVRCRRRAAPRRPGGPSPRHIHDRFEENGVRLLHRLPHGHGPGDLEGDVLAVDGVGRTVDQAHLDVHDGMAADRSLVHRLPD